MSLTILIDLDGTLLINDMDTFLPVYLQALANHLKPIPPDLIIREIMAATDQMVNNQSPLNTLEEVFDRHFYLAIGQSKEQLIEKILSFYRDVFPGLQKYTQPNQSAINFIHKSFNFGYQIAVATNPLFPKVAIDHRLSWAGLPVSQFPFTVVPSFELFHFAKPSPAYYAELMGHIGWPEGSAVMIGNDLEMDILPAKKLNLPVYHLTNNKYSIDHSQNPLMGEGDYQGFELFIEIIKKQKLSYEYKSKESSLAVLRSTPAVIQALTRSITNDSWNVQPQIDEWSITEILAHLKDVDLEVNTPRIKKFLNENNPFLSVVDTDKWAVLRNYNQYDGLVVLKNFLDCRNGVIQLLEKIPEKSWGRSARHAIFGNTSLMEMVSIIANHDQTHIRQIKHNLQPINQIH